MFRNVLTIGFFVFFMGFMATFLSGCFINSRIYDQNSRIQSESFEVKFVSIESSADGSGLKYSTLNLTDSLTKTLYAIERDALGNYIGVFSGSWSVNSTVASLDSLGSKSQIDITGRNVGQGVLKVEQNGNSVSIDISVEASPTINFKYSTQTFNESGIAQLEILLSKSVSADLSLNLGDTSGSAVAGLNFISPSPNIQVPHGVTSIKIPVILLHDFSKTATKNFSIPIASSNGAIVGNTNSTQVNITDLEPNVVTIGGGVNSIAFGYNFACYVKNGGVYCWGSNTYGQIGNGSTGGTVSTPFPTIAEGSGATGVFTNKLSTAAHACAIVSGALKCWGSNSYGQLGDGSLVLKNSPVSVTGLTSGVTKVAAGDISTCAIHSGALKCWGYGRDILNSGSNYTTAQSYAGFSSGVSDLFGIGQDYIIIHNGAAKVFGGNDFFGYSYGLDNGNTQVFLSSPTQVYGLTSGVTEVAFDKYITGCAVVSGALYCWGYYINSGSTIDRPVLMTGFETNVVHISSTYLGVLCASFTNQTVKCFSDHPSNIVKNINLEISGASIKALISGYSGMTCALYDTGETRCFSLESPVASVYTNSFNKLTYLDTSINIEKLNQNGLVLKNKYIYSSTNKDPGLLAVQTQLGQADSTIGDLTSGCSLYLGKVSCWGTGTLLGDGVYTDSVAPVDVIGLGSDVTMLVQSNYFFPLRCAIKLGNLYCWTNNQIPTQISLSAPVSRISNLSQNIGVVLRDGTSLYVNSSNSTTSNFTSPPNQVVQVVGGLVTFTSNYSYCFLTQAGTVYCSTNQATGVLGDGTTNVSATPVLIPGLTGVLEIYGGYNFACARTAASIKCWGNTPYGSNLFPTDLPQFPIEYIKDIQVGADICILSTTSKLICTLGGDSGFLHPNQIYSALPFTSP